MSPAAGGRADGEGRVPVTLPRPGHADLAGALKYGHEDVRNALERASARQTAAHVAAGAVAKALLREIGISVAGRVLEIGAEPSPGVASGDRGRPRRPRHAGRVVEVVAGVPPGLGSYAEKAQRLDARLAAALMGIQAVKGVESATASRSHGCGARGARRDRPRAAPPDEPGGRDRGRRHERRARRRAGGDEAAADADAAARLDRPRDGRAGQALVERSDVQAVEALAVVAEAGVAWELARAAREKFGGDALGDVVAAHAAYLERIRWRTR